jgi:NADH-quinone oxidoreductase subunit G
MTEHVCPVGALTTVDFRFKARVWFLRTAPSICQGCATGCNAWLDYDPRYQKVYRYRPRDNEEVNQYWMCDEGMLTYKWAHEDRLTEARVEGKQQTLATGINKAGHLLQDAQGGKTAFLLSAQHSNEDNFALVQLAEAMGVEKFYVTGKPNGEGDDILRNEDKNPNTAGANAQASEPGTFGQLLEAIEADDVAHVLALGSAVPIDDTEAKRGLDKLSSLVVMGSWTSPMADAANVFLPACTWAEASGTYVNAKGMAQKSKRAIAPLGDSRPAWQLVVRLSKELGHKLAFGTLKELRKVMGPDTDEESSTSAPSAEAPAET